jgi:hypothetical protein
VLESGTCILGGEKEDGEDGFFAVFNDSHDADGVGHLHLGTFGIAAARGVKYSDDILTMLYHDLLAIPSNRLSRLSAHNVFKDWVSLNLLGVSLNVAVHCNHFSPSQELDGGGLAYSGLAQRHNQRGDLLEVRQLKVRGPQEEEKLLEVELGKLVEEAVEELEGSVQLVCFDH